MPAKKPRRLRTNRDHRLRDALRLLVVLRRGRWTVEDIASEMGVKGRTIYRLLKTFAEAGITVELSREREHAQGMATGYYSIPAEQLRKLLRL